MKPLSKCQTLRYVTMWGVINFLCCRHELLLFCCCCCCCMRNLWNTTVFLPSTATVEHRLLMHFVGNGFRIISNATYLVLLRQKNAKRTHNLPHPFFQNFVDMVKNKKNRNHFLIEQRHVCVSHFSFSYTSHLKNTLFNEIADIQIKRMT